jgi:hypothetical protein
MCKIMLTGNWMRCVVCVVVRCLCKTDVVDWCLLACDREDAGCNVVVNGAWWRSSKKSMPTNRGWWRVDTSRLRLRGPKSPGGVMGGAHGAWKIKSTLMMKTTSLESSGAVKLSMGPMLECIPFWKIWFGYGVEVLKDIFLGRPDKVFSLMQY